MKNPSATEKSNQLGKTTINTTLHWYTHIISKVKAKKSLKVKLQLASPQFETFQGIQ